MVLNHNVSMQKILCCYILVYNLSCNCIQNVGAIAHLTQGCELQPLELILSLILKGLYLHLLAMDLQSKTQHAHSQPSAQTNQAITTQQQLDIPNEIGLI